VGVVSHVEFFFFFGVIWKLEWKGLLSSNTKCEGFNFVSEIFSGVYVKVD
jgi:hypothetical protein